MEAVRSYESRTISEGLHGAASQTTSFVHRRENLKPHPDTCTHTHTHRCQPTVHRSRVDPCGVQTSLVQYEGSIERAGGRKTFYWSAIKGRSDS
jgi:hypothetical protein